MNRAITHNIIVQAESKYEEQHSIPHIHKYVHSYHIVIINQTNDPVQLLSRHWFVVNAYGETREIQGLGVIGRQPIIAPGESHEYDSWSPINTEIGKMYGTFTMKKASEKSLFEVVIPEFSLNANSVYN